MYIVYTVLFAMACEGWELLSTEESDNKSTESTKRPSLKTLDRSFTNYIM